MPLARENVIKKGIEGCHLSDSTWLIKPMGAVLRTMAIANNWAIALDLNGICRWCSGIGVSSVLLQFKKRCALDRWLAFSCHSICGRLPITLHQPKAE